MTINETRELECYEILLQDLGMTRDMLNYYDHCSSDNAHYLGYLKFAYLVFKDSHDVK